MRLLSDRPGRLRAPAVRRRAPQAGSERHLRPIISRSKEEGTFCAGALSENARVAGPHASLESVPPPRGTASRSTPAMRRSNESIGTCDEAAQRVNRHLRRGGATSRSTPAMRRVELIDARDAAARTGAASRRADTEVVYCARRPSGTWGSAARVAAPSGRRGGSEASCASVRHFPSASGAAHLRPAGQRAACDGNTIGRRMQERAF